MDSNRHSSPLDGIEVEAQREARVRGMVAALGQVATIEAALAGVKASLLAAVLAQAEEATQHLPERIRERDMAVRSVSAEIGAMLHISDRTVQRRLADAWILAVRFPATHQRLLAGRISAMHAAVICDMGLRIDDDAARADFEARALPLAEAESPARLRAQLAPLAELSLSVSMTERHRAARRNRAVEVRDLPDGMSELYALLPSVLAHGIHDRLTQYARDAKAAEHQALDALRSQARVLGGVASAADPRNEVGADDGARNGDRSDRSGDASEHSGGGSEHSGGGGEGGGDAGECGGGDGERGNDGGSECRGDGDGDVLPELRTMDQLRADVLCDLALGGAPQGAGRDLGDVRAHVTVTVPLLTLAGASDAGAALNGHGAIDAPTARALAAGAPGWDRAFVQADTGAVLSVDRYRPTEQLRRTIQVRDQHCRFPGCRIPAPRCDIDHTVDAAYGGETSLANLACLCRRHHSLKHHSRWKVRNDGRGVLTWTSPHGRTYIDTPHRAVVFADATDPSDRAVAFAGTTTLSERAVAFAPAADPPHRAVASASVTDPSGRGAAFAPPGDPPPF